LAGSSNYKNLEDIYLDLGFNYFMDKIINLNSSLIADLIYRKLESDGCEIFGV